MAYILQIETSGTVCSAALSHNGKLLQLKEENKGYTHAEHLTLFIDEVMKLSQISYAEIDAVAVSMGPGSYTGLRIGAATAKGLCFGLKIPLIGINTLKALSYRAKQIYSDNLLFSPMIDARRLEVYTALFDSSLNTLESTHALILKDDSFKEILINSKVLFFGDGALKFEKLNNSSNAVFDHEIKPSASYLCMLAYEKFIHHEFENIVNFEPFYLKEFFQASSVK
ncbi:MAG: tRNA (adenosine(37)-N6)-threonylcarbamoyltransferase complex dimerization subunit type 1 TsaB [Bacteroidia bacterium]|nr:tRNA (adenosine(37)-N6)-threonylcarbamoyltransferase complex dimerization subunit type 1 TsaB [Bacteroidia bacterium]MCZ2248494.1 tRNA (adenosine(37)-N6)-threonylcarbamoyltransferase complex dimerization subunit type 1 TsaB [Bacteroidia bacterium]